MPSSGLVAHTYFCYPTSPCNKVFKMMKPGPLWRYTMGSQETKLINSNRGGSNLTQREKSSPRGQSSIGTKAQRGEGNSVPSDFLKKALSILIWIHCWCCVEQGVVWETFWGPFQHELLYDSKFKRTPVLKIKQLTKIQPTVLGMQ